MTRAEQFTHTFAEVNCGQHNQWQQLEWGTPAKLAGICLALWGIVAVIEAVLKHGGM